MDFYTEMVQVLRRELGFLIITGDTGCGKTSTVPVKLLQLTQGDDERPIIVTVPRRLAATKMSERLSVTNPTLRVSYHIGSDNQVDEDTQIIFATIGVLLHKLINCPQEYLNYSFIILDEVHEQSVECEVLLGLLQMFRENFDSLFLNQISGTAPGLVLMSAKLNPKKYLKLFGYEQETLPGHLHLHMTHQVAHNTQHEIDEIFLEGVASHSAQFYSQDFKAHEPQFHSFLLPIMFEFIKSLQQDKQWNFGDILVFVPGVAQIEEIMEHYDEKSYLEKDEYPLLLLPLHGNQSEEEQQNVTNVVAKDKRKVILATAVAESSVTFKDVQIVINFCLSKRSVPDPRSGYNKLDMIWASHFQNVQRRGRCGRNQVGKCVHLVPERFYFEERQETSEIQLVNLESVVLLLKKLEPHVTLTVKEEDYDFVDDFLQRRLPDPPSQSKTHEALVTLVNAGALVAHKDTSGTEKVVFRLTHLGVVMASLPIQHRLSTLILLCESMGFLQDGILIAAEESIVNKEMFKRMTPSLKSWMDKLGYDSSGSSDQISALNCYPSWESKRKLQRDNRVKEQVPGSSRKRQMDFDQCNLSFMERMMKMKNDIYRKFSHHTKDSRSGTDHKDKSEKEKLLWKDESGLLLALAIAGSANATNLFVSKKPDPTLYETERKYPLYSSVFLKCHSEDVQLSQVESFVRNLLSQPQGRATILEQPEENSTIIVAQYCDFDSNVHKEQIHEGVLCALQLEKAKRRKADTIKVQINQQSVTKPEKGTGWEEKKQCYYIMTSFVSPNFFGAIPSRLSQEFTDKQICLEKLSLQNLKCFLPSADMYNRWCFVHEPENRGEFTMKMMRGVIKANKSQTMGNEDGVQLLVKCIDTGMTAWFPQQNIYSVPQDHQHHFRNKPGLAIQCHLSTIQPAAQLCGSSTWNKTAKMAFSTHVKKTFRNEFILQGVKLQAGNGLHECEDVLPAKQRNSSTCSVVQHMVNQGLAVKKSPNDVSSSTTPTAPFCRPPTVAELSKPYSPLSLTFRACQIRNISNEVSVATSSVNSIILDPDAFQVPYVQKVLVAGIVQLFGADEDKLLLNRTTLMPSIPGLLELLSLIYSPVVQVIQDCYGQPIWIRTFTKSFTMEQGRVAEGVCHLIIQEKFSVGLRDQDKEDVQDIRMTINELFMDGCSADLKSVIRKRILRFLQKPRQLITTSSSSTPTDQQQDPVSFPNVMSYLFIPLQPISYYTVY